ncbi:NAD-dependent protein deacetylase sirtuin-7 [Homalodisca vitripennis]|uniref:NAD-dependent protein deacetylase sirtuin-7 n=1 Tax=Homalodisca vitripennis TaxID=197043 RepID=UPI001EEB1C47|nr:NAD-dependent protein deacetylase sirtuin-7 [Homalodisca vitripennis]
MACLNYGKVPGTEVEMGMKVDNMDVNDLVKTTGLRRKATLNVTFCVKKERNASFKKVSRILQKSEDDRTEEEKEVLNSCSEVVKEVTSRLEKRNKLKARNEEVEDSQEVLDEKCEILARALQEAKHLVVYSGAGVSTAACIPDYRGSNGIWTRLQQGLDIGQHDLSKTQPTLTHMVLYTLYRRGMLKHVVSQNCDGLHLRSGLPRAALSEVHGNMYLEVCQPCKLEYWRLFDVTEHTARYSHETARRCYTCHKPLRDTIVHFGERGGLKWPINWTGATAAANQADVILCMGSSLKVLKKYPWLWGMDRPVKKRPSLYIVNLQWTPKDDQAALKINGKCDEVMARVMSRLNLPIPSYDPKMDPIFVHATRLHVVESHTYSTAALQPPEDMREDCKRPGEKQTEQVGGKKLCDDINRNQANDKKTKISAEDEEKPCMNNMKQTTNSDNNAEDGTKENSSLSKIEDKVSTSSTDVENDKSKSSELPSVSVKLELPEQNSCNAIVKEEPKSECSLDNDKVKDEPNLGENCKSPVKGIWRPFSFDESSSCSSSSAIKSGDYKTGNDLSQGSGKVGSKWFSNSEKTSGDSVTTRSKLYDSQNAMKKCLVQIEPLDLSCGKKFEPKNEHPYFCKYCRIYYHSGFCLFYRKHSSEVPPEPPCYCCDEEDEKDPTSPDTDVKSPEESDKSTVKVPITNPGWFGKGYRKKIRKKR